MTGEHPRLHVGDVVGILADFANRLQAAVDELNHQIDRITTMGEVDRGGGQGADESGREPGE